MTVNFPRHLRTVHIYRLLGLCPCFKNNKFSPWNRLLKALHETKAIIVECSTFLLAEKKAEYSWTPGAPVFNMVGSRVGCSLSNSQTCQARLFSVKTGMTFFILVAPL